MCLVHVTKNEVIVAVTNLSDREVTVKADTVIATVETVPSLISRTVSVDVKHHVYLQKRRFP